MRMRKGQGFHRGNLALSLLGYNSRSILDTPGSLLHPWVAMKWIVALLLVALELPFAKASSCNALASSTLSRAKITSAETVPPASDLPAFCRVKVILAPSEDSEIRMELWLP